MDPNRLLILGIFTVISGLGIVWGLKSRRRIYEFPFLISLATFAFIVPQTFSAAVSERMVADEPYFLTMIHGVLCMAAGYIGYMQYRTPPLTKTPRPLNPDKIMHVAIFLILFGVSNFIALDLTVYEKPFGKYSTEGMYATEWEGLPVAFLFLGRMVMPGLIIAIFAMLCHKKIKWWHWIVVAAGAFYPALDVLFLGRRFMLVFLIGAFALPLFYVRRWAPRWWMVFAGSVFIGLAIVLLPVYRPYFAYDADHSEIFEIDPIHEVMEAFDDDKAPEFPYQMWTVGAIFNNSDYGYGVDFYNSIIKGFVPTLIVSKERKEGMYLPGANPTEAVIEVYGQRQTGRWYLAEQGIIDSFWQFGFFGCLLFALAGIMCKYMFDRAMRDRSMQFALFSCMMSWLPPQIVYGGFLFAWRNFLLALPVFLFIRWYASMPGRAPVRKKAPSKVSQRSANGALNGQSAHNGSTNGRRTPQVGRRLRPALPRI